MAEPSILDPFVLYTLPVSDWAQAAVDWAALHGRPFFMAVRWPVAAVLAGMINLLTSIPPLIMLVIVYLTTWQIGSVRLAIFCFLSFTFIGLIGVWTDAMITLAMVITAICFSILVGVPMGIAMAKSDRMEAAIRPVLDVMQTLPAFVYLVPIVMLVGIGNVPGVIITVIFALPPVIRLTNLGIRGVSPSVIEAAYAFGSNDRQVLFKVQIPLAAPTIMAGVNQTLMMALGMVVFASMIAVEGLGLLVLRGIGRLDMGLATIGGIGIVLLAMILDRVTQTLGKQKRNRLTWHHRGPIGVARKILAFRPARSSSQ